MIDYSVFLQHLSSASERFKSWAQALPEQIARKLDPAKNKDLAHWQAVIERLPDLKPSMIDLNRSIIQIGRKEDATPEQIERLRTDLMELHPWRKGPFDLFGLLIDTEWRSDLKWDRLKDDIRPLKGRVVLDVGSGNGYHCLRMIGAGADLVTGIDPYLKNVAQFAAVQTYLRRSDVQVLPLGIEDLPDNLQAFDSVFSMGVLYHRRSPFDHLFKLKSLLKNCGELILETLVIEGRKGEVLVPRHRYAKMRNVWFIPSPPTLEEWLIRAGFKEVRLLNVSLTTTEEQRPTDWMRFESLPHFLHPDDDRLTIEGYPRPRRAIFLATKP